MELVTVTIVIATVIGLNALPLISGLLAAPPGSNFLGMIHHPPDYYYYLSQFAQGADGRLFDGFDLYSSEFRPATFVGWPNILMGRVGGLFGFTPIFTYHISLVILAGVYFWLAYQLLKTIFPTTPLGRTQTRIAIILFAASNSLPLFDRLADGTWQITFAQYWFNFGSPFKRLGAVPHQLLTNCLLLFLVWLVLKFQNKKIIYWLTVVVSSFVLSSINPVHWILALLIASLSMLTFISTNKINSLTVFLPIIGIILGGLIPAIYLKQLFTQLPYMQLAHWEAAQQLNVSLWDYLLNGGLVMYLATLGLPLLLKNGSFSKQIAFWGALSPTLFIFSPVASWLHLTNARFTTPVQYLFLATAATFALTALTKLFPKPRMALWIWTLLLILITLPVLTKQLKLRTTWDTNNAYLFLSDQALEAFATAKNRSTAEDNFLVAWPFNITFPGLTGRRSYNGHPLLTIDAPAKDDTSYRFFGKIMTSKQMQDFLDTSTISFVIAYPWQFNPPLSFLTPIWQNDLLALYRVSVEPKNP